MRAPLAALLVALAACACALDADPRALLNSSWGRERGLKVNKVDFVRVSEGDGRFGLRGLVTTAAVKKGEALIHVPKGLGLTLATLKEFGLSFLWEQADLSRMSDHDNDVAVQQHFLTVLIIAIRRNPSHFYSEWLATWPREVHCTLAFTEAEMEELRATDTAAYDEGKYLRRILAWNFDYLNAILTDPRNPKIFDPPITIEEFAQAYTWSMTRDFAVSGGTSDDRAAILPIADYINHSNGKETVTLVELDNGGYEIQAVSHLEPGTELTVTYGKLSNPALINYWGFVMTDNGYNTVTLDAPVAPNAAFGGHKRRLLAEHGERLVTRPKSIDYLLPLLRLLVSDKPESFEEESVNAYLTGMLTSTTEDERKMLAYAVSLCDAALARLSAVPDNVPLVAKATPLSDNLKVILDLRREAKKMLTRMRDILEGMETAKSVGVAYKVPEDAVPDPEETEEEGAGAEGEFPDFAREFLDEQGKMV